MAQLINDAIAHPATGAGAICQSTHGMRGNFEVAMPEEGGLAHYWCDNDDEHFPWRRTGLIAPESRGPGAIIQNRKNGDLEVTVRYGRELRHFWRRDGGWHATARSVSDNASGPASMIQTSYGDNLELLVQAGTRIALYWRKWEAAGQPWQFGGVVAERATGSPSFIQGMFGIGEHLNFEAVYPVDDRLERRWRDNSPTGALAWKPGGVITQGAGPIDAVSITRGTQLDQIDVITQECSECLFQYYRYLDTSGERVFMRNACIRVNEGEPGTQYPKEEAVPVRSFKVNQLTGPGVVQGTGVSDPNILGTDLGVSFEHNRNLYFLFGDTQWRQGGPPTLADTMAYTPDTDPWNGVVLYFHKSYLDVRYPGASPGFNPGTHGSYDVPLDGFSFGGRLFAFFATDHFTNGKVMGRSVLGRCDEPVPQIESSSVSDPLRFHYITEFSRSRFINVSVQPVSIEDCRRWHLPYEVEGLLIWGTGAYRMDHVYLAFMPLATGPARTDLLGDETTGGLRSGTVYYRGTQRGQPLWSLDEEDAAPLFFPAAIGELSVRWNAMIRAFVMMYMSHPSDPIGPYVQLRLSRTPWGPWSDRRTVFNWHLDGMGYRQHPNDRIEKYPVSWFIHREAKSKDRDDRLNDALVDNKGPEINGTAYAPYQIPRYTRRDGGAMHLFYALSTWNPYQVVLMQHPITEWERFWLLRGLGLADRVAAVVSMLRRLIGLTARRPVLVVALLATTIVLFGCGEHATLPEAAVTGAAPQLARPNNTLIPTKRCAARRTTSK